MTTNDKQAGELPAAISFHYIKSNLFRVIRVDGAVGGVNPKGIIQAALYSERLPNPQKTVQRLSPEGVLGEELVEHRVTRDGMVREVEIELLMDIATAKTFADWLLTHVRAATGEAT